MKSLTFLRMTSLGRRLMRSGTSTGELSPTIKLSLLKPTTAEIHTPVQRGVNRFIQNSDQVFGSWSSDSAESASSPPTSLFASSKKSPSKSGSMSRSPATSLQEETARQRESVTTKN